MISPASGATPPVLYDPSKECSMKVPANTIYGTPVMIIGPACAKQKDMLFLVNVVTKNMDYVTSVMSQDLLPPVGVTDPEAQALFEGVKFAMPDTVKTKVEVPDGEETEVGVPVPGVRAGVGRRRTRKPDRSDS
jgi:hypothetical protein